MTEPIDETQPHPAAEAGAAAAPAAAPASPTAIPAPAAAATPASPPTSAPPGDLAGDAVPLAPDAPTLRVDPDRRSDPGWREPAWFPPRDDRSRSRDRRSGTFAIVVGLILIAIGAWYFLEGTLGIDLPTIRWGSLWPMILIVIGGLILLRSIRRKT